jgi:hypothetical protein
MGCLQDNVGQARSGNAGQVGLAFFSVIQLA